MMLRAATAASGGTGAPLATYCSIWAWTLRTRAWTSTPVGNVVGQLLDRRGEVRRGGGEAADADTPLALDDGPDGAVLELHDLGDLGQRADLVELGGIGDLLLLGLPLGDERDGAAVLDGGIERGDALLAPDLERDDHLGEDDRLPEGDERQLTRRGCGLLGRGRRSLGHQSLLECRLMDRRAGSWVRVVDVICGWLDPGPRRARPRRVCWLLAGGHGRRRLVGFVGLVLHAFVVQDLEDALAEALLELEQGPDAGEVHAPVPGEVTDPQDPADVLLRVEADVGRGASGTDEALVLVDPERPRMRGDERRGDADHVDRAGGVPFRSSKGHRSGLVAGHATG